jgi:membrane-bound lytic murein transglycosylase D
MVPPKRAGAKAGEEKPVVVVPVDLQPPSGHNRRFYQPVAGDTLEGVAAALAVSADDLRRWNGLDPRARLQPGMSLMAIMPTSQEFQDVRLLMDEEVRVLVVGSDAFFDHFEGLRGRVRMVTVVRAGETWQTISKRTGLSLGMLERINHRSRSTPLQPGERLVVYVPEARVAAQPKPTVTEEEGAGRAPIEPPAPDSLPPDPEKVMEPEKAEAESA